MKNSVTFALSSVERHANIKINESQVFSMRDAFFVASRGQFISRVHVQLNIREFKLHVLTANGKRQKVADAAYFFAIKLMNKSIRKMENNLLTHTKHETTHFDVLSNNRQTVKVSFLPFAGKINVKLNLSINSLQNFGFSEHPRKLPKALTRVITEIDVPIGKTARSQYVDFHTSCESPHKNC